MAELNSDEIIIEIGTVNNIIKQYLPDYAVETLALPHGSNPKDEFIESVLEGEYEGNKYRTLAVPVSYTHLDVYKRQEVIAVYDEKIVTTGICQGKLFLFIMELLKEDYSFKKALYLGAGDSFAIHSIEVFNDAVYMTDSFNLSLIHI